MVAPGVAIRCGLSSGPISVVKPLGIIPLSRGTTLRRCVSNPKPSNKKSTILKKTYHGRSVMSVRQSGQLFNDGLDREWSTGTPGQFELLPTKPCSVISSPVSTFTHRSIGTVTLSAFANFATFATRRPCMRAFSSLSSVSVRFQSAGNFNAGGGGEAGAGETAFCSSPNPDGVRMGR